MNYLLQNATGNKTSWYEDVTSYLYLSNLPVALVRTIPLACSENFSLWQGPGEDPDEQWWEKGVLGEAVKVAKDCLEQVIDGCIWVASGQFLIDIGTAIWEWGCGASKAVGDKLSDIKTVVVAALNVVLNFLKEKSLQILKSALNPVLIEFNASALLMRSTLMYDFQNFETGTGGTVSLEVSADSSYYVPEIVSFLLSGNFFISLVGLSLAIQGLVTYIIVNTGGIQSFTNCIWDFLLPTLLLLTVGMFSGGWSGTLGAQLRQSSGGIWDFFEETILKENFDMDDDPFWDEGFGLNLLAYLSCMVSVIGNLMLQSSLCIQYSILKSDAAGLALVFAGILFSYLAIVHENGYESDSFSLSGNQVNMLCAFAGLGFCLFGFWLTTADDLLDIVGGKAAIFEELISMFSTGYAIVASVDAVAAVLNDIF